MIPNRLVPLIAVGLLFVLLPAPAQQPANQANRLPLTFTGTWEWGNGGTNLEQVTLVLNKVEEKDGVITFTGTQSYQAAGLKETATGRIDRKSGKISFLMSMPTGPAVTEGSFEGTISAKMEVITCAWIDQNGVAQGELKLTAKKP